MNPTPMTSPARGPRPARPLAQPGCTGCAALDRANGDLKGQLSRAIREREEIKTSLQYGDGAAAFWRRIAKEGRALLQRAVNDLAVYQRGRVPEKLCGQCVTNRGRHLKIVDDMATYAERVDKAKLQLWEVWSTLPEGQAELKGKLEAVWTAL